MLPLLGGHGTLHSKGIQKKQKNCFELLADVTLFSIYIDNTKIVFCYLGSMLVLFGFFLGELFEFSRQDLLLLMIFLGKLLSQAHDAHVILCLFF